MNATDSRPGETVPPPVRRRVLTDHEIERLTAWAYHRWRARVPVIPWRRSDAKTSDQVR